jgi:DNA topoisomerase-1
MAGEAEEDLLPEVQKGEELKLLDLKSEQKFTEPPTRYTEATLIKTLEKMGIGRPSTYAPIVFTIQARMYVEKKEKLFYPTVLGISVNDFLVEFFPKILDYQFTADLEGGLDEIALGKVKWAPFIGEFYEPFSKQLEGVFKAAERVKVPVEATDERCPQCGAMLIVRVGRFGKFLACSKFPDCKFTKPYTEVVEGVKCPECGGEVIIRQTKKRKRFYGCRNYPKCKWASWRRPQN